LIPLRGLPAAVARLPRLPFALPHAFYLVRLSTVWILPRTAFAHTHYLPVAPHAYARLPYARSCAPLHSSWILHYLPGTAPPLRFTQFQYRLTCHTAHLSSPGCARTRRWFGLTCRLLAAAGLGCWFTLHFAHIPLVVHFAHAVITTFTCTTFPCRTRVPPPQFRVRDRVPFECIGYDR